MGCQIGFVGGGQRHVRVGEADDITLRVQCALDGAAEDQGLDLVDQAAARLPVLPGVSGRHLRQRSEEHTSELQSLMRISYAVFCLKKKRTTKHTHGIQSERLYPSAVYF